MEVRSNDESSFRAVYRENFPMLIRVAYHITGNEDLAEEICQDAFIRFFDKQMVFPSEEEAKYWLIRVTKNLSINQIRRHKREKKMMDRLARRTTGSVIGNGEEALMHKETRMEVRQAIDRLPEKYRLVIIMKEYTDMEYKAIARVLHISESNVKVRVYRARQKLEKLLRHTGE